jgi:hypothetical protein
MNRVGAEPRISSDARISVDRQEIAPCSTPEASYSSRTGIPLTVADVDDSAET